MSDCRCHGRCRCRCHCHCPIGWDDHDDGNETRRRRVLVKTCCEMVGDPLRYKLALGWKVENSRQGLVLLSYHPQAGGEVQKQATVSKAQVKIQATVSKAQVKIQAAVSKAQVKIQAIVGA